MKKLRVNPSFFTLKDAPLLINTQEQSLTTPLSARQGTRQITPEWLLDQPNLTSNAPTIKWLDNTRLIYSYPSEESPHTWIIEGLDTSTGERQCFGKGTSPKPSPNGKWIAFVQGGKEEKQVWLMESSGENRKQISHIAGGLSDYGFEFTWSPDSNFLALVHQPTFPYWKPEKPPLTTLQIIAIETGESKQVSSFEEQIRYLSWLPSGKELLFVREHIGGLDKEDWEWVQILNINTGLSRVVAKFEGLQQFLMPALSPDGKRVALTYDADNPIFNFMPSLGIVSIEQADPDILSPIIRLTHELKLFNPQWSPDGRYIYVVRDCGAYRQLYSIDATTGEAKQISRAPLTIANYALSPDGKNLAWIGKDAHATRSIQIASSEGENIRELVHISAVPSDMALSEVREIQWKAPADYPGNMRGLLIMPLNYQEGMSYPLLIDIHGGGEGAGLYLMGGILVNTPLEWQMWAAKGYAVFVPEFRSSASFGSLAITRDDLEKHDIIDCDSRDIEAGIDMLVSQGLVDAGRIGVIGHSAGARRANWLTATRHQFRAVISKEGWADEWILALTEPSSRLFKIFGGAPWDVPENYQKNSPLFHCKGATIPTLFLMGNPERGGVDPHNTVSMLYKALKGQGVETEYVKYEDEGHVFEKPANRRDALERSIRWIEKHLR